MRFQRCSVIALTMAITVAYPTAGFGDSTATPGPTPNIQSPATDYKTALSLFKVEVKLREQNRKRINQVFILAVDEANRKAKTSMNLTTSASTKREILLQQKTAIALANSVRAASILAMGEALGPPVDPNEAQETKTPETQGDDSVKRDKRGPESTKSPKPKK